jgi:hypothetical protein
MVGTPTQDGYTNGFPNGEANGHADGYFPEATGQTRQRKAVIVGAGPVGCLAAIALANKGWTVEVYEGRAGAARCSYTLAPSSAYLSFFS